MLGWVGSTLIVYLFTFNLFDSAVVIAYNIFSLTVTLWK